MVAERGRGPGISSDLGTVGVLGGTGALGRGLGRRFAQAGLSVVLGSRDVARAVRVAEDLTAATGSDVRGASNGHAARLADLVVVAVPFAAHASLLAGLADELAGRVVVDAVNPLVFDGHGAYADRVPEGSAAQQAAAILPRSTVTAAFHHVPAGLLADPEVTSFDLDVLVLGDDEEAVERVVGLAGCLPGARGVAAGRLRDAAQVEALTANLITVNRRHGIHAGVRLTGL